MKAVKNDRVRIVVFIENDSLRLNLNGKNDRELVQAEELFSAIRGDIERLNATLTERTAS